MRIAFEGRSSIIYVFPVPKLANTFSLSYYETYFIFDLEDFISISELPCFGQENTIIYQNFVNYIRESN